MIRTHLHRAAALFLPLALATCVSEPPGAPSVHLTIQASGEGSGLVLAGEGKIYCSLPARTGLCDVTLPASAAGMVLTASAVEGSQFTGWRPAAAGAPEGAIPLCADDPRPDCTLDFRGGPGVVVRPRFELPAIVAVSVLGDGSVTGTGDLACAPGAADPDHCRRSFATGTLVALTASGAAFNGWSAPCDTAGPTCHVTAAAAQQIVAYFGTEFPPILSRQLVIAPAGGGAGLVRSLGDSGSSIDCALDGGIATGRCQVRLPLGDSIRLSYAAAEGSIPFGVDPSRCTAGACAVLLDQDQRLLFRFEPELSRVQVGGRLDGGSAVVTSSPAGLSCSLVTPGAFRCEGALFPFGSQVALRARLGPGTFLSGPAGTDWMPCADSDGFCATVYAAGDAVAGINLDAPIVQFRVIKDGDVGGGVIHLERVPSGVVENWTTTSPTWSGSWFGDTASQVQVTIQLPDSMVFLGWTGDCSGTSMPCVLTLDHLAQTHYHVGLR